MFELMFNSFVYIPEVELLSHMVTVTFFFFEESTHCFAQQPHHFTSKAVQKGSNFPYPCQHFLFSVFFFNSSRPNEYEVDI
jgi:hypothetical protein